MNTELLIGICNTAIILVLIWQIGELVKNTKTTNAYLENITQKLEKADAENVLDEIEEELSLIREELDNTRQ